MILRLVRLHQCRPWTYTSGKTSAYLHSCANVFNALCFYVISTESYQSLPLKLNITFAPLFYILRFSFSSLSWGNKSAENTVLRRQQCSAFCTLSRQHVRAWRTPYKALFSDVSGLFPAYALERWAALIFLCRFAAKRIQNHPSKW